jgi:hypothetical protein
MTRTEQTSHVKTDRSSRPTMRELTPAELRLVTGGQEMDHGGRIRR